MKRITALLLFVLLALGCACPALAAGDAAAADFKPVMRFVASSDTHVRADDDVTAQRIGRMMERYRDRLTGAKADAEGLRMLSFVSRGLVRKGRIGELPGFFARVCVRFIGNRVGKHEGKRSGK